MEERLRAAAAEGDLEAVKKAVQGGADIDGSNNIGYTALIMAASSGGLDVVRYLVEQGADINAKDKFGNSPLARAASSGALDVVRYLIEQGGNINAKDAYGDTPLITAVRTGQINMVRYLVEQGAGIDAKNSDGDTALITAVRRGQIDMMRYLVEQGADINAKDNNGDTALIKAVQKGQIEMVRYLVEQGADINANNDDGETALIKAASSGAVDMVRYLVDQGADINAQNKYGYSPIIRAAQYGALDVVQYLVEHSANINVQDNNNGTTLIMAASSGALEVVRYLIEQGADINAKDKFGYTPLARATASGELEVVRYLVEQGGNINAKNTHGATPLIKAVQCGESDVAQYLVKRGADINAKDNDGDTALIKAAKKGQIEMVRYLVEQGAVIQAKDKVGNTPLIRAAQYGESDVVRYLVEQGADINVQDNDGNTALVRAASSGALEVVRYLVERGADINVKNNDGNTVVIMAVASGTLGVVRYLVEHGADINAKASDADTLLIRASLYGALDMVRYLVEQGADINVKDKNGDTALIRATQMGKIDMVRCLVEQGADVMIQNARGETALYQATKHGYIVIRNFLLKHVSSSKSDMNTKSSVVSLKSFLTSRSWAISPFDIEPVEYVYTKTIGGEYRAKWLDADVVLKLFVSGASASTFEDRVTAWLQLRHPNVIKLYGACDIGHSFFVLEYASNGSVVGYLTECKKKGERQTPWKLLHEAALGLAYLHERGIVHGNLRSSNILVGSDSVAKLTDFGSSISKKESSEETTSSRSVFGSVVWHAPELYRGGGSSFAGDIYSFGLCIVMAVSGSKPWGGNIKSIMWGKRRWDPATNPDRFSPANLDENTRLLTSRMCAKDPKKRVTAAVVVRLLEKLAAKEANEYQLSQPQPQDDAIKSNVDEYKSGILARLLTKIRNQISSQHIKDPLYEFVLREIEAIHNQLTQERRSLSLLETYHSLLIDLNGILHSGSLRDRVVALSSTRAAGNNLTVFKRRIDELWRLLDAYRVSDEEREQQWDLQSKKQLELFVSDVSQTVTVLSELGDEEGRTTLMTLLKLELDTHTSNYTPSQLEVMKKAYDDCCQGEWKGVVTTVPAWYLPWHELVINRMKKLGEGGFGDVYRAKWLDSEVVVKEVKKLGARDCHSFATTLSQSVSQSEPTIESRKERREVFEHEVNVWFGLSHPHVIRLFGACHIGTPFFACEYARGGSLDKYLRKHPDEIWTKLLEAALGVQYLHSRGIIHGDLKCNNIMVGNDGKAKVTDFGLSSFEEASEVKLSGAWHWVAPECIEHGASKRSFASDVYSLGMCIVEALRVVEKTEDDRCPPYPWYDTDNSAVKVMVVARQQLPPRPRLCTNEQWQLVERMCAHDPDKRIKINSVMDELAILAQGNVACDDKETEPERELPSVANVITEMKDMCIQFYKSAASRNGKTLCQIYALLWERLAKLASTTDDLGKIIERARKSTLTLQEEKGTLIAFTEAALRGYSLHRNLDKLIEAKMWSVDTFEWRDKCWKLLTSEAMS